jgi:hypothetical protein
MLRTTILYLHDRVKVIPSGQLVGEWAECLPKAVPNGGAIHDPVEIDLDGITCVDRAGEEALLALSEANGHFFCTSTFARALCDRLGIHVSGERP